MAHGARDFIYSVILYTAMGLLLQTFGVWNKAVPRHRIASFQINCGCRASISGWQTNS